MSVESPLPWGKLAHDADGSVVSERSLAAHCRDVAAVFAALLRVPGIESRLSLLAERAALDAVTCARLSYLVHLHDCGKVNSGFQARRDRGQPVVGHIRPLVALLGARARDPWCGRAWTALDVEALAAWGDAGVVEVLHAVLSHHGSPWPHQADAAPEERHWRTFAGYDPFEALAALRRDAERMFPAARSGSAAPLPDQPRFVHALAGLVQLADWIGSAEWETGPDDAGRARWAEARLVRIGLDSAPWRTSLSPASLSFRHAFGRTPYATQREVGNAPERLVVLESETGSGKTEAALWRFLRLFRAGEVDGLFFALPTRTAAAQLHARVSRLVHTVWPAEPPPVVLAVPGYLDDEVSGALPSAQDPLDAPEGDARRASTWASEHPKRYFAATVSVGTVDQAFLSVLRVKHAHLRGAALMRHLLVVDEVHASDSYMQRLLAQLLRDHLAAGGHALLLSATLGSEMRESLLIQATGDRPRDAASPTLAEAIAAPYPLVSVALPGVARRPVTSDGPTKAVRIEELPLLDDADAVAGRALAAAAAGAKVLVIRNSVRGAVRLQRALERLAGEDHPALFRLEGVAALHHGRFAREDRGRLDRAVEAAVGRNRPSGGLVLIGTQTLEQSLDIDADLLITDLCPADVLLQRLGRLHRHTAESDGRRRVRPEEFDVPRALVLVPDGGLAPFLKARRPGGSPRHGLGHTLVDGVIQGVYPDLVVLEATRRLVVDEPIWWIPAMNRALVERALHSEAVERLLGELGAGDGWRDHRLAVAGDALGQAQVASDGLLRRDRGFMTQPVERDVRLATRLGAHDLLLDLPDGTPGPFGFPVRRLSVARWLVPDVTTEDVENARVERAGAALLIRIGARELRYDRFGLRTAEEGE